MNISPIVNIKQANNILGHFPSLYTNFQRKIAQDTVSFTSKFQYSFESKAEALEYYKEIGRQVNLSLAENDDLTAFESLGYDVESDFETDEITINGDYKPYFEIATGPSNIQDTVTYKEAGIKEKKLLQNVRKITGRRFVTSSFIPDDNFTIDKTIIYPKKVERKLAQILLKRCDTAKAALAQQDNKTALESLGYDVSEDENGGLTINGDYSAVLMRDIKNFKTIADYDIDESELLKKVVEINGSATFLSDYMPDHYIKTGKISDVGATHRHSSNLRIDEIFQTLNPEFLKQIDDIKEALANNNGLKALQILGYDVSEDENGGLTISGNYRTGMKPQAFMFSSAFDFDKFGVDEEKLLENVVKITGNFEIKTSSVKNLNRNLTVEGITILQPEKEDELLSGLITVENISSLYGISPTIIKMFARNGALKPVFKTGRNCYFKDISGENKEFLDKLSEKRDTILTSREIQEKYSVSEISIKNALKNGILNPYCIQQGKYEYDLDLSCCMFDITAPENQSAVRKFEASRKQAEIRRRKKLQTNKNDAEVSA